jgi:quercetin dioxygenase-like cupin family protein
MNAKTCLPAAVLGLLLMSHQAPAQDAFGFSAGKGLPPPRSEPAAWLMELHKANEFFNAGISVAEFLPNTKIAWHHHPGGQILLVTDGVGYYQEKGKQKQILRVGDVIKCPPGLEHWHGSAVESRFTYVAISPAHKGGTVWAQAVTDAEYTGAATDVRSAPARKKTEAGTLASIQADDVFPFDVSIATFAPGKRLNWHKDPGGQILIFTAGSGYYQERGKPKQLLRTGNVIKSEPGVEHWHGAAAEIGATHIAITPANKTGTLWLEKVADQDYAAAATTGASHAE